MTIYFDLEKKAYAFEIENPIATVDDAIWSDYAGTDKWDIVDGVFADITNTEAYRSKAVAEEKAAQALDLTAQIKALDEKRIRAIAEPSIKDETTGATWLEYYTARIVELRTQIVAL